MSVTSGTSPSSVTRAADRLVDLTQHEIRALRTRFNLADAHTHQRQSVTQERIVQRLPELWHEAESGYQAAFEERFVDAFFRLRGQSTPRTRRRTLLAYAASISTLVVAMYLKQHERSVTLIEPCFDNLHDLLRNMRVPLRPIGEELLAEPDAIYARLAGQVQTDALFLVDPNNPTGSSLLRHGRRGFEEVVRFCRDYRKLLVLDLCFAPFVIAGGDAVRFDLYELMERSGISYLAIEDTGKTWPVQDAKCAMITASDDLWQDVYDIHTSVLLNVSPFVLNMLAHYVEDSIHDDMASVRDVLASNRETAVRTLEGSILAHRAPSVAVSVAWFEIVRSSLTATELQRLLQDEGVYVLPGTYFYWSDRQRGERFIRIALAREPELFAQALRRLRETLDTIDG